MPRAFSVRSQLLWFPALAPVGVGAAALFGQLPYRDWDWIAMAMLLAGVWGAALGLFIGSLLAGAELGRSLRALGLYLVFGPLINAVATAALATPLGAVARLVDGDAARIPLIAVTCWYAVAGALAVELLDRELKRTTRPPAEVLHPWDE